MRHEAGDDMDTILRTIQDIPVEADQTLSEAEVNTLVHEVIISWKWEGRCLGRIELARQADGVCVYAYEKPQMEFVSKAELLSQSC